MANQKLNVWDDSYENTVEKIKSLCDYLSCNYNQLLDENTELKERLNKILPASRSINFSNENTNSLFTKSKLLDIVLPPDKANHMTNNEKKMYLVTLDECRSIVDIIVEKCCIAENTDMVKRISDVIIYVNALTDLAKEKNLRIRYDESGFPYTVWDEVLQKDVETNNNNKKDGKLLWNIINISVVIVVSILSCIVFKFLLKV